ncbi:MAG: hypothetical protein NUW02_01585 [Candidatus Campbellbacteria bacterium]|nr:hypothetical protein [Candidatus Campbellbacteria bacterium]
MKHIQTLVFVAMLFVCGFVLTPKTYATFDEVTLETAAIITVGVYDLTIYGSSAEIASITVDENDFSVTIENGSAIVVASADRVAFSHDGNALYVTSEVCSDTESRLGLASASDTTTITVTPSGTCTSESVGGGSSGRRHVLVPQNTQTLLEQFQLQLIELLKQYLALLVASMH